MNTKLKYFTQPEILSQIGAVRLEMFLNAFARDLKTVGVDLPSPGTHNGDYFPAVVALLEPPDRLPDRLYEALSNLEAAASPESAELLESVIQRRIPCVGINRSCPLDCALELWFACPD